jgi:hypothetical protein
VVPNKKYYYRLKQVDYNNRSKNSEIVVASINKEVGILASELMPNPTAGYTSITINCDESSTLRLTVLSMDGREVMEQDYALEYGSNRIDINIDQLDAGTYLCRFETPAGIEIKKLVKSK